MPAKKKAVKKSAKKVAKKIIKKLKSKKSVAKKPAKKTVKKIAKKPVKKTAKAKKPAPKKSVKKPATKKVEKKPAPKAVKPVKKSPPKKEAHRAIVKPSKKVAQPVPKRTVASTPKEDAKKKAGEADFGKKRAYQMQVAPVILPRIVPHVTGVRGRMSEATKRLPAHLQPRQIQDGRYYCSSEEEVSIPSLIEMQLESYKWFLTEGLKELLEEISPITDFSGKKMGLRILGHTFDPPKYDPDTCRRRNLSFEAAMKGSVQLINKETGEIKEQDVFLGSIPLMTETGTFIVGGIERVVVHQLVRSPGVFFSRIADNTKYHGAKIIPKRGVWLEVETDRRGVISCKIDRKRKMPITQLLRIFGYETNEDIANVFKDITGDTDFIFIQLFFL